ncbi:MAG: tetratricopeptide repeat protein [bacterium]|nr:tetratricopeptide repeat protein [bacterium]
MEEYQLALQINTSDQAEVCLFLGLSFDKLGERDRSIESFEKGLEYDSQRFRLWSNLGNVYFDACRFDEAASSYRRAVEINLDVSKTRIAHRNTERRLQSGDINSK